MGFKDRIVYLRDGKDLKQKELAEILGISRSTLASYEQGRREPDFDTLQKIADYFNVSTDYLLGRTEIIYPPEYLDINVEYIGIIKEWEKCASSAILRGSPAFSVSSAIWTTTRIVIYVKGMTHWSVL